MAILQVNAPSNTLLRTVTFNVVLPMDKLEEKTEAKLPTLYLLHGMFGSHEDWLTGTRVARWAGERGIAVVMPSGENRFYVDDAKSGEGYGAFIGEELPAMCRKMFPLSGKREDTAIAGLSMGGYGAMRNGLKYADTFGHVAALSAAFLLDRPSLVPGDDDSPSFVQRPGYYEAVFGDPAALPGSDKDYRALALAAKENGNLPNLYIACGTEDELLGTNRAYHRFLTEQDIPVTYEESPGGHDWDFWDTYIKKVLDWLAMG